MISDNDDDCYDDDDDDDDDNDNDDAEEDDDERSDLRKWANEARHHYKGYLPPSRHSQPSTASVIVLVVPQHSSCTSLLTHHCIIHT